MKGPRIRGQMSIAAYALGSWGGNQSVRWGMHRVSSLHPCCSRFLRVLSRSLPLFLTLAWIYSVSLTVKALVREKETRLRYTMHAMGLSGAVLWLGWFLSCLGPFLLSTALLVMVLKVGVPCLPGCRVGVCTQRRVTGRGSLVRVRPPGENLGLIGVPFISCSWGTSSPIATPSYSSCSWRPSPWPRWSSASC